MQKNLHKVVVDTSSLISFVHGNLLDIIVNEFHIVISDIVHGELKEMATYQDENGKAAREVLDRTDKLEIRKVNRKRVQELVTSRLDEGEASCILLAREKGFEALIYDDYDSMHQIQAYARVHNFDVGLGAVLIHSLVLRGRFDKDEALHRLEMIASKRNWIGRPIYRAYKHHLLAGLLL